MDPKGASKVQKVRTSMLMMCAVMLGVVWLVPSSGSAQTYDADIRPLIDENCVGCHSPEGLAFSMEDSEDTYERRRDISRMVTGRRMPPWLAEAGHQQYEGDLSLSEAEVDRVKQWADAGFPRGAPYRQTVSPRNAMAFESDMTLEILPGASYLPNQTRFDDYRCFVVDWPGNEPLYITGFGTTPGNALVSHHTVVYAVDAAVRERFHELAEAEEGHGYECFGGALPDRILQRDERAAYEAEYPNGVRELANGNYWLAHWAPGMFGQAFPEETGILMEPGGALVVQMHYYSADAPGESDAGTKLAFQTAESVARPAFHFQQTSNEWLDARENGSMVIPVGEKGTFEVTETLGDWLGYVSFVTKVPREEIVGLDLHSANLHMHANGHSGVITLQGGEAENEVLLNVPRWDLRWQRDFMFTAPKTFDVDALDDTHITVQCTFENLTEETVYGGFGSDEEMCFNFSYIAVRTAPDSGHQEH
ncbi:MAG: hypothetical protein ACR2QM_02460 [Longimicrobiales bacterium]